MDGSMLHKVILTGFLAMLLFPLLASHPHAQNECLKCHEELEGFRTSAHRDLGCLVCHEGLDVVAHLRKGGKGLRMQPPKTCTECHDAAAVSALPHHGQASKSLPCTSCHDPHGKRIVKERKEERRYCLSCHGKRGLTMRLLDGETLSLFVDEKALSSSSHGKNQCSFCHSEFSFGKHPKRSYESKRDFSLSLAPTACARCHLDECKRYERCVHGAVLRRGGKSAPTCTDCHSPHEVRIQKEDENLNLLRCADCHKGIYEAYKSSVHYRAWKAGRRDVPLCTGCHRPHEVVVTSFNLRNNEVCLRCHKAGEIHVGWFYNPPFKLPSFVEFHLKSITCNVCHAPQAQAAIYLHPYEKLERNPISIEEVTELLGVDRSRLKDKIDLNRDSAVEASELWRLFDRLLQEGKTLTLLGWMDVKDPIAAHATRPKQVALKDCELCHRHDSPFFREAFILFRDQYGWPEAIRAHKDVLSTRSSLSPLSEFYIFGSTRLKLVDLFLMIVVCLAALVPIGHIALRLATRSLRVRSKQ